MCQLFAKWCLKFPLMAWEGKVSEQGVSSINELMKPWRGCFFLGVLCYKGITTVWKINKLHHVQHLIRKTGWQAETWETWVSYWPALWCGANRFARFWLCPVPIRLPALHRRDWVLLNVYALSSTVKPMSHPRLLGILVAHLTTPLNSSISYGGKSHEKYSVHAFLCVYKSIWHEKMPQKIL